MKEIISHISYLIQQYDCVVIPNLGGFVLNRQAAMIDEHGTFLAPVVSIGFNTELKYNDGLLIQSYIKIYDIPYDVAENRINLAVKAIKGQLATGANVVCGNWGLLKVVNKRIVFAPNSSVPFHNSVWGVTPLAISCISEQENKILLPSFAPAKWLNRSLGFVASSVAILALLCFPLSTDSNVFNKVQQSGFFVDNFNPITKRFEDKTLVLASQVTSTLEDYIEYKDSLSKLELTITPVVQKQVQFSDQKELPTKRYYIVIAGDSDKNRASKLLTSIKRKGFTNSQIIESKGMHRVFVASFANKDEANKYLSNFRINNPDYNDAWLFTKRQN